MAGEGLEGGNDTISAGRRKKKKLSSELFQGAEIWTQTQMPDYLSIIVVNENMYKKKWRDAKHQQ